MNSVSSSPSLWASQLGPDETRSDRPMLGRDLSVDVAIIGAGFTGLWTAYYLAKRRPDARIAVIESKTVGFGASGRNGGWCMAELADDFDGGMHDAMVATVDEVQRVCKAEGIDCDLARGGEIRLARSPAQRQRLQQDLGADDRWLDADEATDLCGATRVLGGAFIPHTAALHPAKLVHGLAGAVERLGVSIYERTRATEVEPGVIRTAPGTITADSIVLATEAYTAELKGHHRDIVPLYSLMIATEPLSDSVLDEVRLATRPTFADARHRVIYGQRTADGRIAFGGRSVPYRFGSRIDRATEQQATSHEGIRQTLVDLFPVLSDVAITHRWGGVLAAPRNWKPFVSADHRAGLYRAGGYIGEGVAAANLAGRTVTDLIIGEDSDLVSLPWVQAPPRRWPVEPFRWLGIRAGTALFDWADKREASADRPSGAAELVWKVFRR